MLIKNAAFTADSWLSVGHAEPLPESKPVIVSWTRWVRDRASLEGRRGKLGVRLPNDLKIAAVTEDLSRFDLIALDFPRFTDGRAYSQARLLRGRYGFRGELRATGNVLRDQLFFMARCGFDSFDVGERAVAEGWLAAFGEFDVFYQPSADNRPWAMRLRLEASGGVARAA